MHTTFMSHQAAYKKLGFQIKCMQAMNEAFKYR